MQIVLRRQLDALLPDGVQAVQISNGSRAALLMANVLQFFFDLFVIGQYFEPGVFNIPKHQLRQGRFLRHIDAFSSHEQRAPQQRIFEVGAAGAPGFAEFVRVFGQPEAFFANFQGFFPVVAVGFVGHASGVFLALVVIPACELCQDIGFQGAFAKCSPELLQGLCVELILIRLRAVFIDEFQTLAVGVQERIGAVGDLLTGHAKAQQFLEEHECAVLVRYRIAGVDFPLHELLCRSKGPGVFDVKGIGRAVQIGLLVGEVVECAMSQKVVERGAQALVVLSG